MTKMKSFIKQFVATVKGDADEVKAQKAYRRAVAGLKTQISSLEGETVMKEDAVENFKDILHKAKVNNGNEISDPNAYVSALVSAKNDVTKAEDDLERHLKKINFLKEVLDELNSDVE